MVGQSHDGGGALEQIPLGYTIGTSSIALQQTNLPGTWGGNAQPVDNRQPSLAVRPMISLAANGSGRPAGEIVQFAGGFAAQGYLIAGGQELKIDDHSELYAVIGKTYGGSDGKFCLPDLRGRAIIGA